MNTQKNKKWHLVGGIIAALAVLMGSAMISKVQAATSDNVELKVTVAVNVSVNVGTAAFDLGGNLTANETVFSTGAIPVTNDTGGLTEDLQIDGSDSANWTAGVSTNTGTNTFNLRALISTNSATLPVYDDFSTTDTGLVNGSPVNLTNAAFGWFASGSGDDITSGETRYLYFRFITPASISAGNNSQQTVTVTVTAAASSTY